MKHMLGSTGESLNYIEENTHIAYLCELLERVWGHGLKKREVRQGPESMKGRGVVRVKLCHGNDIIF